MVEQQGDPSPAGRPRDRLSLVRGGEGVITGTVVCAAAIAAGAGHTGSTGELSLVILATVTVYWIAHLHAVTIGSAFTHRHQPLVALRHAVRETLPLVGASVAPLVVLLLSALLGAETSTAAWCALFVTIGLLAVYSYVAGARSGLDRVGRLASALAGAGLGVLVALLKAGLH